MTSFVIGPPEMDVNSRVCVYKTYSEKDEWWREQRFDWTVESRPSSDGLDFIFLHNLHFQPFSLCSIPSAIHLNVTVVSRLSGVFPLRISYLTRTPLQTDWFYLTRRKPSKSVRTRTLMTQPPSSLRIRGERAGTSFGVVNEAVSLKVEWRGP